MKRWIPCFILFAWMLTGCDSDDSDKTCTPKCPTGQVCTNGVCQNANAPSQQPTDTGTSPDPNPPQTDDNHQTDQGNPPADGDQNDQGNKPTDGDQTDQGNKPTDGDQTDQGNKPTDGDQNDQGNKPTDGDQNNPEDNPAEGSHACGSKTCKLEQLCLNGQCVDRNNQATEGVKCDPKTFVESCDNNNLVHCDCDEETKECKTAVSICDKLTCALMVKDNYGMCAKADEKCKAEGELTMCYDIENGFTSYIEYLDCTLATDGKYYPFRTDKKDVDCIGTCLDKYSCNLGEEKCGSDFKDYCDGEIATYCADGKVYRMNCADYGAACSIQDDGSLCDYGG